MLNRANTVYASFKQDSLSSSGTEALFTDYNWARSNEKISQEIQTGKAHMRLHIHTVR